MACEGPLEPGRFRVLVAVFLQATHWLFTNRSFCLWRRQGSCLSRRWTASQSHVGRDGSDEPPWSWPFARADVRKGRDVRPRLSLITRSSANPLRPLFSPVNNWAREAIAAPPRHRCHRTCYIWTTVHTAHKLTSASL